MSETNPGKPQPYKDDTSDGTTAVKSSDDLAREAAGIPHPEEGHDVRDYRPSRFDTEASEVPENPGYVAPDDSAVQ